MHASAMEFVRDQIEGLAPGSVLEIGAQDINGAARSLCPEGVTWFGVDLVEGPGVDLAGDATTMHPGVIPGEYDMALTTNVLEHVPDEGCAAIINLMADKVVPGGSVVVQAAGEGFAPHSGRSQSSTLEPDEFYRNVPESLLEKWLVQAGCDPVVTWRRDVWPHDVYGIGVLPRDGFLDELAAESDSKEFVIMERAEFESLVTNVPLRIMAENPVKVWPLVLD